MIKMKLSKFNKGLKEEFNNNYNEKEIKVVKKNRSLSIFIKLIPAYIATVLVIAVLIILGTTFGGRAKNSQSITYKFSDLEKNIEENYFNYIDNQYVELQKIDKETYDEYNKYESSIGSFGYASPLPGAPTTFTPITTNMEDPSSVDVTPSPASNTQYQTNNQEEGVVEGDIAKFDGTYCYYVNNGYLFIYDLNGNLKATKKLGNELETKIQIYGNDIVVYSSKYDSYLQIFEFKDNKLEAKYNSENKIIDTRLLGDYLYIIEAISTNSENNDIDFDNLYYDNISRVNRIIRIKKINLESYEIEKVEFVSSSASIVYMNETNIVISNDNYYYPLILQDNIAFNYYAYINLTLNTVFDLELNSCGVYVSSGNIKDKYSIDVYDGYLRIVSGNWSFDMISGLNKTNNMLTIFSLEEKKIISNLGNIGLAGETVKSVAFTDDICYVVTYRNTDPLYEIDITDPYNPRIIDALKVPGYSAYLKPFEINGEKYIFGAGYTDNNNFKYSIYKDDESNTQIGSDYVLEYQGVYETEEEFYNNIATSTCINPIAMFFYNDGTTLYFGVPINQYRYKLYKIDVLDLEEPIKNIRHIKLLKKQDYSYMKIWYIFLNHIN